MVKESVVELQGAGGRSGCSDCEEVLRLLASNSVGDDNGSPVGCNANTWNAQASVRTANWNNAASNGNDNYAGALASSECGTPVPTCPARVKKTDNHVTTGEHGQGEYEESESHADLDSLAKEIGKANKKRKLKNLRRFFLDRRIVEMGFDRCIIKASPSKELEWYKARREQTVERIIREFSEMTYDAKPSKERMLKKRCKSGKERQATVSCVYDRIVQNIALIVVEKKLRNEFPRNIYSGIPGRGMMSNDKRYCLIDQVRKAVMTNQGKYAQLTDIRKFYENLRVDVALERLFRIIKCPFTQWLFRRMFSKMSHVPIGSPLSQLLAMLSIVDGDKYILSHWKVKLFCFGDNRLIIGNRKDVLDARDYLRGYYQSLHLEMKNDYQLCKVSDGFTFCKYRFHRSYVRPRAELRRRAVQAYRRGKEHYSTYHGIFSKTDAHRLRNLIESYHMDITNGRGMRVPKFAGEKRKFLSLKNGTKVAIVDFAEVKNNKPSEYYIRVQYIVKDDSDKKRLCVSTEGSFELKEFFRLVKEGAVCLPMVVTVNNNGKSVYFEEFHTTDEEACEAIVEALKIEL